MTPPAQAIAALLAAARRMDAQGWLPATAGNLSLRLAPGRILITRSGCHKGQLSESDLIVVDESGTPLAAGIQPSSDTLLHCGIYRRFPEAGAVVHGHSIAATVLSRQAGQTIRLVGYEMLKVFPGYLSSETALLLPVLNGHEENNHFQAAVEAYWAAVAEPPPGYLIRGHGAYVWGSGVEQALARLEALEFMLACELAAARRG